jgi:hypothetical protein
MKIALVFLNAIFFGFTILVRLTDGPARESIYVVFGWLLILVPLLNVILISQSSANSRWLNQYLMRKGSEELKNVDVHPSISATLTITGVVLNIVLLGFVGWAIVDQYPHPNESGFFEYLLIVITAPVISLWIYFRNGVSNKWFGLRVKEVT